MNFEQDKQLLRQMPIAVGGLLMGVLLTITIGQYQGSIEIRFGEGYLKVVGEPRCEIADQANQ
jgi:hypothetical protein